MLAPIFIRKQKIAPLLLNEISMKEEIAILKEENKKLWQVWIDRKKLLDKDMGAIRINEKAIRKIQQTCIHKRKHESESLYYTTICVHCDAWMDITDGKLTVDYNPQRLC